MCLEDVQLSIDFISSFTVNKKVSSLFCNCFTTRHGKAASGLSKLISFGEEIKIKVQVLRREKTTLNQVPWIIISVRQVYTNRDIHAHNNSTKQNQFHEKKKINLHVSRREKSTCSKFHQHENEFHEKFHKENQVSWWEKSKHKFYEEKNQHVTSFIKRKINMRNKFHEQNQIQRCDKNQCTKIHDETTMSTWTTSVSPAKISACQQVPTNKNQQIKKFHEQKVASREEKSAFNKFQ